MLKSLESRLFVATEADIEELTRAYLEGVQACESNRGTYLTAHIATTQSELGSEPRLRAGKASKLSEEEIAAHLKAMNAVNDRFYAAVVKAARDAGFTGEVLNRKTNFVRSSKSTLKAFISAGGDVCALAAGRTSKTSLRAQTVALLGNVKSSRQESLFENKVSRWAERIEALTKEYAVEHKEKALEGLEDMMGQLARVLSELGGRPVRDEERAIRECKLLKTDAGMFMPLRPAPILRAVQ